MNDFNCNHEINSVNVATSLLLLRDQYPKQDYRLETMAAAVACLDKNFRQEVSYRMREEKRRIVLEMLRSI